MKTSELTGAYLDYWTGLAMGKPADRMSIRRAQRSNDLICVYNGIVRYDPSTNPVKGMEVIDGNIIELRMKGICSAYAIARDFTKIYGSSFLEAACRATVGSVFGAEVPDVAVFV